MPSIESLVRISLLSALLAGLVGCNRSVARPPGGDLLVAQLEAEPAFVPGSTPFEVVFRVLGSGDPAVSVSVNGEALDCTPLTRSDGRSSCTHPGLNRATVAEGAVIVRVEARDGDQVSVAETSVTLDVTCPRALTATLEPAIAEPGNIAVVTVEASEVLNGPPTVTRLGRDWGVPEGDGRRWQLERTVTAADPALTAPVQVVLTDRAGNRNLDCNLPVELSFASDQRSPVIDVRGVVIARDAPGQPTVFTATVGAFRDDVGVVEARVYDETGRTLIATFQPAADGSVEPTPLGAATTTRVLVEAVDGFGRTSGLQTVTERWRVALGTGSFPGVALRTGVRLNAPPPGSRAMLDRTVEAAPDVARIDARAVVVRASVGFEKVGDLPSFYEGIHRAFVGYEPTTDAILAIGGHDGTDFRFFSTYVEEVLVLTWDDRDGAYVVERIEPLSIEDATVPPPGFGYSIAFDGEGCGVIWGGQLRVEPSRAFNTALVWQLCATPGGYRWTQIPVPDRIGNTRLNRLSPVIWDPVNRRYIAAGSAFDQGGQVAFLEPGPTPADWRVSLPGPLPTAFNNRSQNYLFFDPRLGGFSLGLGSVFPIGNGEQLIQWTYQDGVWRAADVPLELGFRTAFGFAYDEARSNLVVWGGGSRTGPPETDVWYLTGTATSGPNVWRRAEVEFPTPRDYPSMVYDPDREVVVMFGGAWYDSATARPIPPEIHQLISQPSFPFVVAEVELGARRPQGVDAIELSIRASGVGDGDALGPSNALGGGVNVVLWDYEEGRWRSVGGGAAPPEAGFSLVQARITDRPERFIATDGRLAVAIRSNAPATEARAARLEVDLVDGRVELRPGVQLP